MADILAAFGPHIAWLSGQRPVWQHVLLVWCDEQQWLLSAGVGSVAHGMLAADGGEVMLLSEGVSCLDATQKMSLQQVLVCSLLACKHVS